MIKIINLYKKFGENEILKGVSFVAKKGETTVILGKSGSGKSTIIKHIVALLKPTSGQIFVDGIDVAAADEKIILQIRKKVGFLFQNGALFDSMNIFDNVAFALREHTKMSKKEIEVKVFDSIEMVGLNGEKIKNLFPDELSGGMRKRVALARTLVLDPKIILYDEPTSGLDPITSDLISRLIVKLQRQIGATSIVISHDITESFKIADSMAMLENGKILVQESPQFFKTTDNKIIRNFIDGVSDEKFWEK